MRWYCRPLRFRPLVAAAAVGLPLATTLAADSVRPVVPGDPFPTGVFANLNSAAGGPAEIDLTQYLGKKPLVLYYWIATNTRSETVFLDLEKLVGEIGADRIGLVGAAVPRENLGEDKIRERLSARGIRSPVLSDVGFRVGKQLGVSSVPHISVIDADGRLRLTNGASLSQVLGYDLDLAKAIRRTAETGDLMTYGYLDPYFPVRELEGEPSPDFTAPQLRDGVERQWHDMLDHAKLNVLIFWSVDCPHCRKSLPEINAWLRENPDGLNVVSCAHVNSEATRSKTLEFCEKNDFRFPTLADDSQISELYKVTSTPTIVIIGPDGVVDSAIISGYADFGRSIQKKKEQLLKGSGTSG